MCVLRENSDGPVPFRWKRDGCVRRGFYDAIRRDLLEFYDFGGASMGFEHIIDPIRRGTHVGVWLTYPVPCLHSVVELL